MPYFFSLLTGLAAIASFIIKHPFVSKMMIFSIFVSLIGFAITYIQGLVTPYISGSDLFGLAVYLGVLDGINLYITIILAGWGVKQILAFVRS